MVIISNNTVPGILPISYPVQYPVHYTDIFYKNIDNDYKLRKDVTNYFCGKVMEWCKTKNEFKKYKNKYEAYSKEECNLRIYRLLRQVTHKYNMKWYKLRTNRSLIKEYFLKHL